MTTFTIPNTCRNCGQQGHYACNQPKPPALPAWVCPVCGTGCAPWLATHCNKPAPSTASTSANTSGVSGE